MDPNYIEPRDVKQQKEGQTVQPEDCMLPSRRFTHIIAKGKDDMVQRVGAGSPSKELKTNFDVFSNVMKPRRRDVITRTAIASVIRDSQWLLECAIRWLLVKSRISSLLGKKESVPESLQEMKLQLNERPERIQEMDQELLRKGCVDSSSKYLSAERVAFKQVNQPIMCDDAVLQDSQPPAKKISMLPGPIPLLLELKNTAGRRECILVGAVVHATSTSLLEFYFFNAKDMAICVGVGLPRAKVIVRYDFSIIIEETSVSENEHFLRRDDSCRLIMEVQMETPGTQAKYEEQTQVGLSRYGVGFDFGSLYVDDTYDAAEVSWPLLYDMALFILTSDAVQCHETKGKSSAEGSSGSFQGKDQENDNMAHKLHEKRDSVFNPGGGDRDEDGSDCNKGALEEDDQYPPVVSKVTVFPLPKCDFATTNVKPDGLNGASIAPKLVFEFRKNGAIKRISIEAHSHLQLGSEMDVFSDTDRFGWYHTDIQISLGCEDRRGHGRVASLEQNSCRILNPKTSYKYIASKSITSTQATTYTAGGQANLNLFGSGLQGSASGSGMQQEATTAGENIEMTRECICEGFSVQNSSCAASPAHATFRLFYPLQNLNIWADREFLQGQGLFSTIEPSIAATWIPLNEDDTSPYFFKVERSLKLQHRFAHPLRIEKQQYYLPFYVNHAMTHLRNARRSEPPLELFGNQQSVPDVLMIGSVH